MNPIDSLGTSGQWLLSVVFLACGVVLFIEKPAEPGTGDEKGTTRLRAALWAMCMLVAVYLVARGRAEFGVGLDSWSDLNVIVSGRNYAREGLTAHCAAAQHQVVTDTNPSDAFFLYVRYPVGSNLVSGVWQRLGVESVRAFRLLPAACSLISVWVWLAIYRRFASKRVALIAALFMATSFVFLVYADNLHFHAYAFLTTALAVECFLRGVAESARHRAGWLLLSALCIFTGAWFTWEYHLWLLIFIVAYAFFFKVRIRYRWLVLLTAPLVLALALQSWQRRCVQAIVRGDHAAPQSQPGFLDDIYRRTIGFETSSDTPEGVSLATYPAHMAKRIYTYYGIPWLAGATLIFVVLQRAGLGRSAPGSDRRAGLFLIVLLAAGAGWWLVMLQHASVHPHVMRLMLPAYAWLVARVVDLCLQALREPIGFRWAAAAILLGVLALNQAEGLATVVRIYASPDWVDGRGRTEAGLQERELIVPYIGVVPEGGVILTNYNRPAAMRYWLRRPVYQAWFWPTDAPATAEPRQQYELAFNHLRELYADRLPPLYYIYRVMHPDLKDAYREDPLLRLFVSGATDYSEDKWPAAQEIMEGAAEAGSSERSFCPIVKCRRPVLCFRIDRVVPQLREALSPDGFPTLKEFGPMP